MKTRKLIACLDALVEQVGPERAKWQSVHEENLRLSSQVERQVERIRQLEEALENQGKDWSERSLKQQNSYNELSIILKQTHTEQSRQRDRIKEFQVQAENWRKEREELNARLKKPQGYLTEEDHRDIIQAHTRDLYHQLNDRTANIGYLEEQVAVLLGELEEQRERGDGWERTAINAQSTARERAALAENLEKARMRRDHLQNVVDKVIEISADLAKTVDGEDIPF